jgi:FtsZ-binding cell division protein ZapB
LNSNKCTLPDDGLSSLAWTLEEVNTMHAFRGMQVEIATLKALGRAEAASSTVGTLFSLLDDEIADLAGQNRVLEIENHDLRATCDDLKRRNRHLRQRLDIPSLRDLIEYAEPEIPSDDSLN